MRVINWLKLVLLTTVLFSCESKYYDLDLSNYEQMIAVNSFFEADKSFSVNISSSLPRTSTVDFSVLEDAEVLLFENDILLDTLTMGKSGFSGDAIIETSYNSSRIIAKEGKRFKLKVSSPGFKSVYAESKVPLKGAIIFKDYKIVKDEYDYKVRFNIEIKNENENYYYFTVASKFNYSGAYKEYYLYEMSDLLLGTHQSRFNEDYLLFSSENLPKGNYPFSVTLGGEFTLELHDGKIIYFELMSLSYDAWRYLTTLTEQKNVDLRISEPIKVHSNINDGVGIFAGINVAVDSLVWDGGSLYSHGN